MNIISDTFNFDNIGGKIKVFTKWSCWISIALTWITMIILFVYLICEGLAELCWIPIVGAFVFPVITWIGCWGMYAFGELVDNSHKAVYGIDQPKKSTNINKTAPKPRVVTPQKVKENKSVNKTTVNPTPKNTQQQTVENAKDDEAENVEDYIEVKCKKCGRTLYFDTETTEAECPWCNQHVELK